MTSDTSQRAQINCAATLAYIEGRALMSLSQDEIEDDTLAALSSRVKPLEFRYKIDSPPPSTEPTWESLAWRICHVKHSQGKFPSAIVPPLGDTPFIDLLPDGVEGSIETLQTICSDINTSRPMYFLPTTWPKGADDDKMLGIIWQRLCYTTGREQIPFPGAIPTTRKEIYAKLVALSLRLSPAPLPRMGAPPGWGGIPAARGTKLCCGCCNCNCHGNGDDTDSSSVSSNEPKRKRTFGFGWLRKLVCWRNKADDDSASMKSVSSYGSSTILGK